MLPKEFIEYTSALFGAERWQRFVDSFNESTPVSVRLNPYKAPSRPPQGEEKESITPSLLNSFTSSEARPVPWCRNGYWLSERPQFTLDPLFHAGVYYVQEAGSMFLDEVLRQVIGNSEFGIQNSEWCALDLCAAPGGKSTLMRAALSSCSLPTEEGRGGVLLLSNEPDHRRANILMENMQKQGHPDVIVTNNYPRDYRKSKMMFDLILTDVPCSGEGMFRRDEATIKEWSIQNVHKCAELQRSIVEDIWPCLRPGGILIYSTCTFNVHEDEENVRWIMEELGADILPIETKPEWNITGSLLEGWDKPVYRFIPGTSNSEGLFMAVLRKHGDVEARGAQKPTAKQLSCLRVLSDGHPVGEKKGKDIIPAHAEALNIMLDRGKYPMVELSLDDALRYLHRETLVLPDDTPRGYVIVTYKDYPLGFMKNLGNRANNLYPKEWAIRNLK